jgi:putative heme-binding domain-containing protein
MRWSRKSAVALAVILLPLVGGGGATAQTAARKNPFEGNADAARRGSLFFRARCAGCHGLDAKGVSGPDLTAVLSAGMTDERFFRTIRSGVAGTEMPRFTNEQNTETQIWEILTHLRTLSTGGAAETVKGNSDNGMKIFRATCAGCHTAGGQGGQIGPDLSRIGASRSVAALRTKLRSPGRQIVAGYQPVTLVMSDDRRVRGLRKNEDAFSIQIMDMTGRIQGYAKQGLRDVVVEDKSPMPIFGTDRLSDADLNDLLSYLTRLRGTDAPSAQ